MMQQNNVQLEHGHIETLFELHQLNPLLYNATISITAPHVAAVYTHVARDHQRFVHAPGFARGQAPLSYVEENFRPTISHYVEQFLFKYVVINAFYREIRKRKLVVAGQPRLTSVSLEPSQGARFTFEVTIMPSVELQEWKYFPFKAPKRKKYKDLDRQVEAFINEEKENHNKHTDAAAKIGDWVSFDICLVDENKQPIVQGHKNYLWLKLGDEEADSGLRDIFLGKSVGDIFYTTNKSLADYFSDIETNTTFCITVTDIVHHSFFCLESFKKYFKLKTNKEIYQKLVEVFSYRNDLSQRRSMVEEAFKLLLAKHRFTVPNHLVLRKQKEVLEAMQDNPDYHVYRMQKDFEEQVRLLADKQAREELIIDHISYQEGIVATNNDIKTYLNLIKRPRTKEFIYFTPPVSKLMSKETPVSAEELRQICTREKTLNHIIFHLTQK